MKSSPHRAHIQVIDKTVHFIINDDLDISNIKEFIDEQVDSWLHCCGDKVNVNQVQTTYKNETYSRLIQ